MKIKTPKYLILSKITNSPTEIMCEHCSRSLLHPNHIKNTETSETFYLGDTCTKNYLGVEIKDIVNETKEYNENIAHQENYEKEESIRRTFVQSFREVNIEMMQYIENNQDNNFMVDMKKRIEETGTLTKNMYTAIYCSMLKESKLDEKIKDLEFNAIKISKKENQWGMTYTLFGETNEGELIRVFFSSLNEKNFNLFVDKKIMDRDGFISEDILDNKISFLVSGNFDGYKIKRAKIK